MPAPWGKNSRDRSVRRRRPRWRRARARPRRDRGSLRSGPRADVLDPVADAGVLSRVPPVSPAPPPRAMPRWVLVPGCPLGVVVRAVGAAIDAVQDLGKAKLGDKTLLDALVPFREALSRADSPGREPTEAWRAAAAVSYTHL